MAHITWMTSSHLAPMGIYSLDEFKAICAEAVRANHTHKPRDYHHGYNVVLGDVIAQLVEASRKYRENTQHIHKKRPPLRTSHSQQCFWSAKCTGTSHNASFWKTLGSSVRCRTVDVCSTSIRSAGSPRARSIGRQRYCAPHLVHTCRWRRVRRTAVEGREDTSGPGGRGGQV